MHPGYFDLSMRDLSALADGFSSITIGHAAPGVLVRIGDIEDGLTGLFTFSARLDDITRIVGDRIEVRR